MARGGGRVRIAPGSEVIKNTGASNFGNIACGMAEFVKMARTCPMYQTCCKAWKMKMAGWRQACP